MSAFTAPAWDVDVFANRLCDKFAGSTIFLGKKNAERKQNKKGVQKGKQNHQENEAQGKTGTSHRLQSTGKGIGQENSNSQVLFKTKKRNFKAKAEGKSKENCNGSVHSSSAQTGEKVPNSAERTPQTPKSNVHKKRAKFSEMSNDHASYNSSFASHKLKKIPQNSQYVKTQNDSFTNKRMNHNDRSAFENNQESSEKRRNKRESMVPNNLSNANEKVKKLKRNVSHLSGTGEQSIPNSKKRKLNGDFSNKRLPIPFQKTKIKKNLQNNDRYSGQMEYATNRKSNNSLSISLKNSWRGVNREKIKINKANNHTDKGSENSATHTAIAKEQKNTNEAYKAMPSPYFQNHRRSKNVSSLRVKMLLQLKSSRFRYINEQLYTSDSKAAGGMFKEDPDLFKIYHDGFKQQVEQWPLNPIEKIIKSIQRKSAELVVADFGCGDALLAKSVKNKVHSFDLVALSDEVTVCDMAHTPLENNSIDICVFCLSLMGTNLASYLIEANRILKVKGVLKIAEVASRFDNINQFITDMKKYGFTMRIVL